MRPAKGLKKFTRSKKAHPSDYVTFLTNYHDAGPNLVGTSKIPGGQTDITFYCNDGMIRAHQLIVGNHSKLLKKLFLEQHSMEFSLIDFEKGVAQMTGRRASDQPIDIILPDFKRDDVKRLLSCFYTGEILIDDEVQSLALRNLWKTLCIDSIKLSDLEFIEVEVHKQKKVIQETKSSLIQRIENNVNNVTTPQSLIQRIENNVNNLNTPQRPNQNNKYSNHTPQQQIVGTVKNMKPVRQLQQPQRMLQQPQGMLQQPQGMLQKPQGILQQPQGMLQKPQGMLQQPLGMHVMPPHGITQQPQGMNQKSPVVLPGLVLQQPLVPLKSNPVSVKTSLEPNQKFKCAKCQAGISLNGNDVHGNLKKFQMHLISHFQDKLFSDVPFLSVYICPQNGEKCKENMKNRITFLCHLSLDHAEFYPRMQRIMSAEMGLDSADAQFFNNVILMFKTYSTLKIDLAKCPSQFNLTDELAIYKEAERDSLQRLNNIGKFQCQKCGLKCSNQDYAVLHQFLDHSVTFVGQPRIMKDVGVYLSCQECKFITFSKSQYLSHIGYDHGKFNEISTILTSSIKGASIDISQLFKSNQSKKPSIQNKMDEMTYSISATGVNYECSKCHVNSTHFATFCLHLQRFHKLPMIFKCKQCQKAAVQNKIDEAEFKGHRCYNFQTAEVQEISAMGLNPGPAQAESIQQAYISKNLHFNNQNDQQEITGAVNGVKRASFEMAQSAGTNQKKFRTDANFPVETSNSSIGELINLD